MYHQTAIRDTLPPDELLQIGVPSALRHKPIEVLTRGWMIFIAQYPTATAQACYRPLRAIPITPESIFPTFGRTGPLACAYILTAVTAITAKPLGACRKATRHIAVWMVDLTRFCGAIVTIIHGFTSIASRAILIRCFSASMQSKH